MTFEESLILTPSNKIKEWRNIIFKTLERGQNVIWVGDTETTGINPRGNSENRDLKDRLLEIAMLAYVGDGSLLCEPLLDSEGTHIFFHEYINPFIENKNILERYNSILEIPQEVIYVHGITKHFLEGKSGLLNSKNKETNYKLPRPAKPFFEVKPALDYLICADECNNLTGRCCFLAHNCHFDILFMDCEYSKVELLHDGNKAFAAFESFFMPIDSLFLIKNMYTKNEIKAATSQDTILKIKQIEEESGKKITIGFGLEFLRYFYGVDEISRDVHGALIDSVILAEVYKKMTTEQKFLNLPTVYSEKASALKFEKINENNLITL